MEAVLGLAELRDELKRLPEKDQILHIDLTGRDPDDGMTRVPYEKGALFLRTLERAFGASAFDDFLRAISTITRSRASPRPIRGFLRATAASRRARRRPDRST